MDRALGGHHWTAGTVLSGQGQLYLLIACGRSDLRLMRFLLGQSRLRVEHSRGARELVSAMSWCLPFGGQLCWLGSHPTGSRLGSVGSKDRHF